MNSPQYKRCPKCQAIQIATAKICTCGHQFSTGLSAPATSIPTVAMPAQPQPAQHHPTRVICLPAGKHSIMVAILLGFLIPGLGQFYNQQYAKGIAAFLCFMFGLFITLGTFFILVPLLIITELLILTDAIGVALRLRRGEALSPWESF